MHARPLFAEAVLGSARGLVATVAMSVPMLAGGGAGIMGRQPPKRITDETVDSTGLEHAGETERHAAATAAHLAFGVSNGALFSVLRAHLRPPGPSVVHGLCYAVAVWAASYKGWVPALGALPPPEQDRPRRQRVIFLAHLVYGAVLGGLSRRAGRPGPRRRRRQRR